MTEKYIIIILIVAMAVMVGISIVYFMPKPAPPGIPIYPYIMENEQVSTSSSENPNLPSGWLASMYHGLTSPVNVYGWYKVTLEDLGWMVEVENFNAYLSPENENITEAIILLAVTESEWASMVFATGWYIPETGGLGECVIIIAQGPKEGLSWFIANFGELTPETFI